MTAESKNFNAAVLNFTLPKNEPRIPPALAAAIQTKICGGNVIPELHKPAMPESEFTKINGAATAADSFISAQ